MMIDPFLLLAPFLLLGVIALLRLVGCDIVFGLEDPEPSVTSVSPDFGPLMGGTVVTIQGTLGSASVKFDGQNISLNPGATTKMLSFVTPQHDPGSVDVVVTNGTGSTTTKFTYRDPAFVQASASNTQMNNSVAATYPNAQGNENLNIVVVGWGDFTSSVTKISDNLNGDYDLTLQVGPFQGPSTGPPLQQTIFYRPKINPGSGNVVTVQFNNGLTPATAPDIRILEYTGLDPSDPLDGTPAAANGTGTAADSGPAATSPTFRTGIIFGAGTSQTTFSAAGFPPNRTPANANGNVTEDNVLSAAGNYNATAKNSSGNWLMQAAIFTAP